MSPNDKETVTGVGDSLSEVAPTRRQLVSDLVDGEGLFPLEFEDEAVFSVCFVLVDMHFFAKCPCF